MNQSDSKRIYGEDQLEWIVSESDVKSLMPYVCTLFSFWVKSAYRW